MLHTNGVHRSLALWAMQFKSERSSCTARIHNGLCAGCSHLSSALVVKLDERITGETLNNFNIKQYGKY